MKKLALLISLFNNFFKMWPSESNVKVGFGMVNMLMIYTPQPWIGLQEKCSPCQSLDEEEQFKTESLQDGMVFLICGLFSFMVITVGRNNYLCHIGKYCLQSNISLILCPTDGCNCCSHWLISMWRKALDITAKATQKKIHVGHIEILHCLVIF